jgi:hypothetical protein
MPVTGLVKQRNSGLPTQDESGLKGFMQGVGYKSIFLASLMLPKLMVANGCSGSPPPEPADTPAPEISPASILDADPMTHEYIMEAIYYNKRLPEYFYREPAPPEDVFQTIQHIKNSDIVSSYTAVYELCTDSADEALQWSETAKRNLGDLVEITDSDLYFQFDRVPPTRPNFRNLQRIYKCEMLDRSLVDLNAPDEHLGFYYSLPPQPEEIRKIIEYLWTFSILNNYGNAVLKGEMEETVNAFGYALYQARLVANLQGDCDTINIYRTLYSADKNSGNISYSETLIDSLQTKFENIPTLCN